MVECLAGGAGMDGSLPVEGEQRRLDVSGPGAGAAGGLLADQCGDARPVRDQAALAESAAPHDQQRAAGIDIA
jgi:hypothetical protein